MDLLHLLRVIIALITAAGGAIFIVATAPTATADDTCGPGYYWSTSHQTCVESPDSSTSNVTAICRDGSDSHSLTHSGTCSGHGGVAQWCPCGAAAPASTSSADADDQPDPAMFLKDLRQTRHITADSDNDAIAGGLKVCNALRAGNGPGPVSQGLLNGSTYNLSFSQAADIVAASTEWLCPELDPSIFFDATRLAGRNPDDLSSY